MVPTEPKPELLVIVGETASGKSELALKVAQEFRGEIISADSWTVYRGFDIGTGKPTIRQQKAVKHHLIDVREPTDGFNAPMFKQLAQQAITDIQQRGKLPILVGGTGLYIDSVLYDFGFLPTGKAGQREKLNKLGISELLARAEAENLDLTGIDIRNKRRIIRAIEAGGAKPAKAGLRPGSLIVGLKIPNEQLRQRVQQRTEQMIKAGLAQEVKHLSKKYGWEVEPMKGIGYQQWRNYFDGGQTLEQTRDQIVSATMGLAKRQRTWFKRDRNVHWFGSIDQAYSYIYNALNK